jgi:wyosine [tRNA(Phe)-imidazoG37] synthetase (radical SAM superfamily)
MKYAYGPVPSRRLGRSIGVSPIPPKVCSYSCVYCQLGRTNHLQATRESFFPREAILSETLALMRKSDYDFVTFAGDGEPTLCKDLGWLIGELKKEGAKVAVITNGSLLWMPEVREALAGADVVLPTLDAGDGEIFKKVNRPYGSIVYDKMLQGLIDFREGYHGQIWLEAMLVDGINDGDEELKKIKRAIDVVRPDRVYINVPIRPPAESWARIPKPERLIRAEQILGSDEAFTSRESGEFGIGGFESAREAIIELCSRHPLREEQARKIEKEFKEKALDELLKSELTRVNYNNESYLLLKRFLRA